MSHHPAYLSCQLLEAVATSFPLGNTVDPAVTELDLIYQAPSLPYGSVPVSVGIRDWLPTSAMISSCNISRRMRRGNPPDAIRKVDKPYDERSHSPNTNAVTEQQLTFSMRWTSVVKFGLSILGGFVMQDNLWLFHYFSCNTCIMIHSATSLNRNILHWILQQQSLQVLEVKQWAVNLSAVVGFQCIR